MSKIYDEISGKDLIVDDEIFTPTIEGMVKEYIEQGIDAVIVQTVLYHIAIKRREDVSPVDIIVK